jgi:hypothetical protein
MYYLGADTVCRKCKCIFTAISAFVFRKYLQIYWNKTARSSASRSGRGLTTTQKRKKWGGGGTKCYTAPRTGAIFEPALRPTQPPNQWISGALCRRIKGLGRETNHSFPSSAEVKNAWSYTTTPQYVFMEWCLVK